MTHLNRPEHLPPVECPIVIEVAGQLLAAHRTGFIAQRNRDMEYQLASGELIVGRYPWTYP